MAIEHWVEPRESGLIDCDSDVFLSNYRTFNVRSERGDARPLLCIEMRMRRGFEPLTMVPGYVVGQESLSDGRRVYAIETCMPDERDALARIVEEEGFKGPVGFW